MAERLDIWETLLCPSGWAELGHWVRKGLERAREAALGEVAATGAGGKGEDIWEAALQIGRQ